MTEEKRNNRIKGILVSLIVNGALVVILMSFVLPVVYPPPPPKGILIEFPEEELKQPPIVVIARGDAPERVTRSGGPHEIAPPELRLSNKTRAPRADNRPDAKPSTAGDEGDVERYEPIKPKVDKSALFYSNNTGTEELDNKTRLKDKGLYPGTGTSDDPTRGPKATPGSTTQQRGIDFSLEGRSASGKWPLPEYSVQQEGRVKVDISVDKQGKVVRASINPIGTTTSSSVLQNAALAAAKKATFNADATANNLQTGTITYVFKLK